MDLRHVLSVFYKKPVTENPINMAYLFIFELFVMIHLVMEHLNSAENEHKGLDLTSSVLDRLSQKVMR